MTTAIEELEKLVSRGHLPASIHSTIAAILPRLRTEDRDGKREALSQSARDLVVSWAIPLLERALRHHGSGGQMIPCCDGHVKLGELKLAITDDYDSLSTRHARAIGALRGLLDDMCESCCIHNPQHRREYEAGKCRCVAISDAREVLDEEAKG